MCLSILSLAGALLLVAAACGAHSETGFGGDRDWLVYPCRTPASVRVAPDGTEITLGNGLIQRVFRTTPDLATIDYRNLVTGVTLLRGVKPEATITVGGRRWAIGGLRGQPDYAYLDPDWLPRMTADPDAFHYTGYRIGKPVAPFPWKPARHAPISPWPPRGVALVLDFAPPPAFRPLHGDLRVSVHYELYQGIPVLAKWISFRNAGDRDVRIERVENEILAVTEDQRPRIHLESNYAFAGMDTTHWGPDGDYTTQVDYEYQSPILLASRDPLGPDVLLRPGDRYATFRTVELLLDSDDRERRGLARRRVYRALAPHAQENPILMHLRESDSASIRRAVDQCAEVGFEMVILTFWSGFDIESEDPSYIARIKADVDYARSKGIELGGYTLMCASRDVGAEHNVVSPATGRPGSKFGQSACLASAWADGYFRRVLHFMDATGLRVIETDGPFHGDVCASTTHAHHRGLADSQRAQWEACCRFYRACRERGIYVNTPDWYFLNGANKTAMGYRETNFSLPRERQILISRQNIHDGTFDKTSAMGWMFVPLVEYHGGGAAATFEPLSEHLADYEWHLAQNFGSGVQACYRGPRLYDTDATKAVVKRWVDLYKRHRAILDSDIIHVRRADGRGIDCMMHVNPALPERALAMVYNPTRREVRTRLRLPLYYAGLAGRCRLREKDGRARELPLDRNQCVTVPVRLAPRGITWFVVEEAGR